MRGKTTNGRLATRRRSRRSYVVVAVVLSIPLVLLGTVHAVGVTKDSGHVRAVITFIGDSNESLAATAIVLSVGDGDQAYATVFLARTGASIRTSDCTVGDACTTYNLWKRRIGDANARIDSDAFVVDLGINDTIEPGSATGPGYKGYPAKVDWLMALFGGRPVFWTNIPCSIEPENRAAGCRAVNRALSDARTRWRNLILLNWAAEAKGHREYLLSNANRIHLSSEGQQQWSAFVKQALDRRFPT